MTVSTTIDIGQIIIASLFSILGYFIKGMINRMEIRLDKHDETLGDLASGFARLTGVLERRDLDSPMRSRKTN